ncbi:MAG: ABC transporter ATP-binding protein/permease [Treponema sp.]|nr:ABC transporter ATP-binding protein/permease [Treponema sp.]
MRTILRYLKPYFLKMAGGLTIKFSGTIMDLFLPWILAYVIDYVAPRKQILPVCLWGGLMVGCSILAVSANVIANRMAAAVARDAVRTLRHDLFAKISLLSCAQIDAITVPSLVARLSSDTYNVHRLTSGIQRLGIRAPILLLGGILITLSLDPMLTLVLLAVLPFTALVIRLVSKKGIPLYTKLQGAVDVMIRVVRENITGIRIVKALSKTDYEKQRFAGANGEVTGREWKANVIMGITNPAMSLLLNLGLVAVIIVGAHRVNAGQTPPGEILAFLTYFTIILNATLSISRMFVMYSRGSASAGRIAGILILPEDLRPRGRSHKDDGCHISFEKVFFSYQANSPPGLLEDISFSLKRGETLGILGETGCGKSTLLQLLLRFYDVDSGHIRINGDDIRGIPPDELYAKFGVVFQKDVLFAETIRENIAFGRNLTEEELRRAVQWAQAGDFINALEEGLDHRISARGTTLSGGQRQRLLIARALAAAPEILLLDDSSSALDYRTDAELRRCLEERFRETTTIIVAQRISSVRRADHILVLDQGRIAGYGSHGELLQSCPVYQEINWSQTGRPGLSGEDAPGGTQQYAR